MTQWNLNTGEAVNETPSKSEIEMCISTEDS